MRAIDIHAHWYPQEWLQLFEKDGAKEGARLERTAGGDRLKTETLVNSFDERFVELASRIEKMDEKRINVHALSLTTPMVNWASPALGLALAQAYNDAAAAAHGSHRGRFPRPDRAARARHASTAGAQAHAAAAGRVPQELHLRDDRPRRPYQHEPHPAGGRRPRDPRQRLLLRHGPRRSPGRGPTSAAEREGKEPDRGWQRGAATSLVSAASSQAASRHRPRPARCAPRGRSIPASAA